MSRSWLAVPDGSPFPVTNLPWGVVDDGSACWVAVPVGDQVLQVGRLADDGLLDGCADDVRSLLSAPTLDQLMGAGRGAWRQLRDRLRALLTDRASEPAVRPALRPVGDLHPVLPFTVADYVDFYSSEHHARNVAEILFRDPQELPPAWRHLPIGYHGRAGSVVVGGTDVVRPSGLRLRRGEPRPTFGPSRRLDVEVEVGFVVGTPSQPWQPVPGDRFADHVFGVVLLNDWSARDLQGFESNPLGPFLGKSFATSVSPWVVTLDALGAAWVDGPDQEPAPATHLEVEQPSALDLSLELELNGTVVSRPPFRTQYWSPAQQLGHLTSNGAWLRTGDLFASGTVTGPEPGQRGSLLELSWGGSQPIALDDGSTRTFLADGDDVVMRGWAPGADGTRIGFGDLRGRVRPALG